MKYVQLLTELHISTTIACCPRCVQVLALQGRLSLTKDAHDCLLLLSGSAWLQAIEGVIEFRLQTAPSWLCARVTPTTNRLCKSGEAFFGRCKPSRVHDGLGSDISSCAALLAESARHGSIASLRAPPCDVCVMKIARRNFPLDPSPPPSTADSQDGSCSGTRHSVRPAALRG